MFRKIACLGFLVVSILLGCAKQPPERSLSTPADPAVLAVYAGGEITVDDIDRAIIELPDNERPSGAELTADRYQAFIRHIVAERLLLARAEEDELASKPQIVWGRQQIRRQIVVQAFLQRHIEGIEPPSEEELSRRYEADADLYRREAKRRVTHLFKRIGPGDDPGVVRAEIEELRRRVLAGENLALLARNHSDSESRHHDGNIGWVARGQLPAELEAIIFDLDEGVPSRPIVTKQGIHLFRVESAVDEKQFSFVEIRDTIGRRWLDERTRGAADQLAEDLPADEGLWVVEADELWPLVEHGDGRAPVLIAGDHEVSAARFRQLLSQSQGSSAAGSGAEERASLLLDNLVRTETIYAAAVASGLTEDRLVAAQLERAERDLLVRSARSEALRRTVTERHDLVEAYYRNNELRFSTPLRLRLRRIRVSVTQDDSARDMFRLEDATAGDDAAGAGGSGRLDRLARELGVEVEEVGWTTIQEVAVVSPAIAGAVAELQTGGLSPPYQNDGSLEVLEVAERREPEPQPLAAVLEAVQSAYLADNEPELYRIWMDGALGAAELEIFSDRVDRLGASRSPSRPNSEG